MAQQTTAGQYKFQMTPQTTAQPKSYTNSGSPMGSQGKLPRPGQGHEIQLQYEKTNNRK